MSGAMRKIGEYLGLLEDTGHYDDYDGDTETTTHDAVDQRPVVRERRPAPVSDLAERRRPASVQTGVVAELSRITTLHPRNYNEARLVGENYRDGTPVIMNLSEMDDNDAKRLVDFAAGLVFATRGTIERVTAKVFLLSPPNVSVAPASSKKKPVSSSRPRYSPILRIAPLMDPSSRFPVTTRPLPSAMWPLSWL